MHINPIRTLLDARGALESGKGVQTAYLAILGGQAAVGLLSALLLWAIYKREEEKEEEFRGNKGEKKKERKRGERICKIL
ncbi:Protein of unknown function [Gryllus bimaculatus]|nr:Protein of unknown function [Gryllus bimaculatus]